MSNGIISTIWQQLNTLNRLSLRNGNDYLKFELPVSDEKTNTLQVIVKRSAGMEYKYFVRYDAGMDTYSVRFGKIYTGSKFERADWGEYFVTDWESNVYAEDLLQFAIAYIRDTKKLVFHSFASEVQKVEAAPEIEEDEHVACMIAAGWI